MTSFLRLSVISLLCGVAALGHAAAWLHVAGCDSRSHWRVSSQPASTSITTSCDHGCCHHADDEAESSPERTASEESSHSHGGHDSDSCLICQSLGLPNGVAWPLESLSIIRADVEIAKISSIVAHQWTFLSIPQSRGPPARLA